MLAILIASAIAASLLVELGLAVTGILLETGALLETADDEREDERQMNGVFKRTSGAVR